MKIEYQKVLDILNKKIKLEEKATEKRGLMEKCHHYGICHLCGHDLIREDVPRPWYKVLSGREWILRCPEHGEVKRENYTFTDHY